MNLTLYVKFLQIKWHDSIDDRSQNCFVTTTPSNNLIFSLTMVKYFENVGHESAHEKHGNY